MKIGFAPYLSQELNKYSALINLIEAELNKFVANKDYGSGVLEVYIGLICVSPQFEPFFKQRRPKYDKEEKITEREGVEYKVFRTFQYDLKLDFETFKNANEEEASKILVKEILHSLKVFDEIKTKIKDFDLVKFKEDLESYFKEKELI